MSDHAAVLFLRFFWQCPACRSRQLASPALRGASSPFVDLGGWRCLPPPSAHLWDDDPLPGTFFSEPDTVTCRRCGLTWPAV